MKRIFVLALLSTFAVAVCSDDYYRGYKRTWKTQCERDGDYEWFDGKGCPSGWRFVQYDSTVHTD